MATEWTRSLPPTAILRSFFVQPYSSRSPRTISTSSLWAMTMISVMCSFSCMVRIECRNMGILSSMRYCFLTSPPIRRPIPAASITAVHFTLLFSICLIPFACLPNPFSMHVKRPAVRTGHYPRIYSPSIVPGTQSGFVFCLCTESCRDLKKNIQGCFQVLFSAVPGAGRGRH